MSREHYAGRKLLTRVRVTGLHAGLEGREVPAEALTAHVLCRKHNAELGSVDQEALTLHAALLRCFEREQDVTQGVGFWTPTHIDVNCGLFSRWLCKLHCNSQTLDGNTPDELFVRYCFGQEGADEPRFYLRAGLGDRWSYQRRILYSSYFLRRSGCTDCCLFHVFFMGLHFLVSPIPLTSTIQRSLAQVANTGFHVSDWMEKPHQVNWEQRGIVTKTLRFDWGDALGPDPH